MSKFSRMSKGEKAAVISIASGIVILALALNIGLLILAGFMFYWNITDIVNVGVNFWNVAWLVVATFLSVTTIAGWVRNATRN